MATAFDAYHKWLGIPPEEQPPNHYRLLAVKLFEADLDVIQAAADQRMSHLRKYQRGQCGTISQRLLNEVAAAKLCLLSTEKKTAYDAELREKLRAKKPPAKTPAPAAPKAAVDPALGDFLKNVEREGAAPAAAAATAKSAAKRSSNNRAMLGVAAGGGAIVILLIIYGLATRPDQPVVENNLSHGPGGLRRLDGGADAGRQNQNGKDQDRSLGQDGE